MRHAAVMIPGIDRLGGAEQQAMLLAKGLRQRGWRVTMVALSGTGGYAAADLRDAGVGFVSLRMRKGLADPRGWIAFHRWLKEEQPDVLHAHLPHATWMARWSRVAAYVPVVIDTLHSSHTGRMGRHAGYWLSRWLPDCVTAVSEAAASAHRSAGMVRTDRLNVLANGIDMHAWQPDAGMRDAMRAQLGLGDAFLWLAVGRLEAVKDYPTLLQALARTTKNTQLVVLGDGPKRQELIAMAARMGLEQKVCFVGFAPGVSQWMQAADGFVLSSRYEGLPMVVLEAGASGLPSVATDVPGTREAIVDGETGFLARAGDAQSLSNSMERMMGMTREARHAMGMRARQHVEAEFSLKTVLDRWERLYVGLLGRNTVGRPIPRMAWEMWRRRSATSA